jgi:hypothetical protein
MRHDILAELCGGVAAYQASLARSSAAAPPGRRHQQGGLLAAAAATQQDVRVCCLREAAQCQELALKLLPAPCEHPPPSPPPGIPLLFCEVIHGLGRWLTCAATLLCMPLAQVFDYKNVVVEDVHLNKWAGAHFVVSRDEGLLSMPGLPAAPASQHHASCWRPR